MCKDCFPLFSPRARLTATAAPTIALSSAEQLLREFLLEAAQDIPDLEIWVTGGWVRDRLLGIDSSDIDLALNCLTGRQFGLALEQFSRRPDILSKYGDKAKRLNIAELAAVQFTIIERNAEAAKQLETAHGRLFGLDIDMVNLRKEVYKENSRTPEMEFGTPEEDAFRRDATINALFFHLKNQQVVDLTGRGLDDLQAKLIRTPLDPFQTFMEDPLRVLRLIRIGSRLQFTIHPDALDCMTNDVVQRPWTESSRETGSISRFSKWGVRPRHHLFSNSLSASFSSPSSSALAHLW